MNKDSLPQPQSNDEVDLGQLFNSIGKLFERFFRFLVSILNKIFLVFVWLVFFIKKHLIKLVIAGAIGFVYGLIKERTGSSSYKSTILVKQNYNTGESLYSAIDFYNALVGENDTLRLAKNLNISPTDAGLITGFDVEPSLSENEKLRLYDAYTRELDTNIATKIDYITFIKNSEEFDYALQRITLKSKKLIEFNSVLAEIVKNIENSKFWKNEQQKNLAELTRREEVVIESLKESDSLQKTYQKVLESKTDNRTNPQTSITIDNTEDNNNTNEYRLYNKDIELRRELVDIMREKDDIQNIIEIVSSEQNQGTLDNTKPLLGIELSQKVAYSFLLAILVFILLLIIEFLRFLERYKSKI